MNKLKLIATIASRGVAQIVANIEYENVENVENVEYRKRSILDVYGGSGYNSCSWAKLHFGVQHGSVLRLLLFIISVYSLFL